MKTTLILNKLNEFAFQLQCDLDDLKHHTFCDAKENWSTDIARFKRFKRVNNLYSGRFTKRITRDIETANELDLDLLQNDINIAKSKRNLVHE